MESHSWVLYISIVVLLGLSAFFGASETSLSTINKIRLKKSAQDGNARARVALELTEQYDKALTTILVGNNLVCVAASTIGTLLFTSLFGVSGAIVSTVVFTILFLVVEVFPKSFANANSDTVALHIAKPLRAASFILAPLCFVFRKLQKALYGRGGQDEKAPSITEEELLYFIESIEEEGVIDEQESNLVQSALEFDETTLREVITPRVNLEALDVESTQQELTDFLLSAKHSRAPVYETSVDNIIGILFVPDAMRLLMAGKDVNLRGILEEPCFVHKGMKLSDLLSVFQSKKAHMAVVLDEYGGTLGIVTPIDLLEELVGDIYNDAPESLTMREDGSYEIDGGCDLWDMFDALGVDHSDIESDYSTVNGWAMSLIGFIPGAGESFSFKGYDFTVLETNGTRISRLSAKPAPAPPEGE